tara:strand:- start:783 stop:983 length:201 start_codon:yes stop_codon:yes gene_type:complete
MKSLLPTGKELAFGKIKELSEMFKSNSDMFLRGSDMPELPRKLLSFMSVLLFIDINITLSLFIILL